jgi:hypothetical protein
MMDTLEAYSALVGQLQKAVKGLKPDEAESLGEGASRLVVLHSTQRIVAEHPALDLALRALKTLTEQDLQRIAAGGSSFKIVHKGGRVSYPVDVAQVAQDVSDLGSEPEIIKYLDADERLTPAELKKVAGELGIVFPKGANKKDAMVAHMARSIVVF